jgi:hypothetical protein
LPEKGNRELAVATRYQFLSYARGNGSRGGLGDAVVGDGGVERGKYILRLSGKCSRGVSVIGGRKERGVVCESDR